MRRFGLFGRSLDHSFSPQYFKTKFQKERIQDCSYDLFEIETAEKIIETAQTNMLEGFNVTIPFKEKIIPFLDRLTEEAESIGAVNCVEIQNDEAIGHNTDHIGFWNSIELLFDSKPGSKALILGSGGASKAVAYALEKNQIETSTVSRSGLQTYSNLHVSQVRESDIIINTTPLGTHPNTDEFPDIPFEGITASHLVYDLVYNPSETLYLKKARLAGAKTINGLRMLELQAEESWKIWNS